MAGIGYELKKIFKDDSIIRIASGVAYSSVVVIGPTVIVIATVVALYTFLGFTSISYYERELLSSTVLYAFIFSLLLRFLLNSLFKNKSNPPVRTHRILKIPTKLQKSQKFSIVINFIIIG